jgi:pyruvate/2-oxoglutarate dehydrogenase complex dihydrolipoamide dehydrogenase (E3) component
MLRRFGAEVDLFEASGSLLEGEDPRVGELILAALRDDGIRVHLDTAIAAVSRDGDLRVAHHADGQVRARHVIVAVGRKPRVDGPALENVGIQATRSGIPVDERCRAAEGVWAEVAAVGMTEAEALEAGIDVRTVHLPLRDAIARPWTYETDPRGELAVIADARRKTLVGAWAVGPLASEWIHYAALAIKAELPCRCCATPSPSFRPTPRPT